MFSRLIFICSVLLTLFIFLMIPQNLSAFACCNFECNKQQGPWFTGPLLTSSAGTVAKGHWNFEPQQFATQRIGGFNSHWNRVPRKEQWDLRTVLLIQYGISDAIDVQTAPQIFTKYRSAGVSETHFGDLSFGFDFRLIREDRKTKRPNMKVGIRELFPTGSYQKLNPAKAGADTTGGGSFATQLICSIGKLYQLDQRHYVNTRLSVACTKFHHVDVKGYNAYGGGFGTKGRVFPGSLKSISLGLEYTLTPCVNLACDLAYQSKAATTYKGARGVNSQGAVANIGSRSSENFIVAPALEYTFSKAIGVIGGFVYNPIGKNINRRLSYVIAININI